MVDHSGPQCDYPGCQDTRTHVSRCREFWCKDGKKYQKACDKHMNLLCAPEMVW